jgi:hypothetical protein
VVADRAKKDERLQGDITENIAAHVTGRQGRCRGVAGVSRL